jgi:type III secretory pathway component EscR
MIIAKPKSFWPIIAIAMTCFSAFSLVLDVVRGAGYIYWIPFDLSLTVFWALYAWFNWDKE